MNVRYFTHWLNVKLDISNLEIEKFRDLYLQDVVKDFLVDHNISYTEYIISYFRRDNDLQFSVYCEVSHYSPVQFDDEMWELLETSIINEWKEYQDDNSEMG